MKHNEEGVTLIELMVVLAITALLLTLGAQAVRHFWFVRSLSGGRDQVATQLRQLQQRAASETHPVVYGARFNAGSESWGLVRYDPVAGTCQEYQSRSFDAGVQASSSTSFTATSMTTLCRSNLTYSSGSAVPGRTTAEFVFFYARGSATAGTLGLTSTHLDRSNVLTVSGVTGRVAKAS